VLLDYGCGDGSFLEDQAERGFVRVGYEPDSTHASALATRLSVPVYSDPSLLEREHVGTVDVLTMHFVLEHVTDLDGTFRMASRLLSSSGELYVVLPQPSSFEARLFGKRWHGLDPPRHISFPERAAIMELARRQGMDVVASSPVPFPNGFAGSIPVVLSGRFRVALFAMALPFGIAFARALPEGARAYRLRKT
jgi:hypothetical protein